MDYTYEDASTMVDDPKKLNVRSKPDTIRTAVKNSITQEHS